MPVGGLLWDLGQPPGSPGDRRQCSPHPGGSSQRSPDRQREPRKTASDRHRQWKRQRESRDSETWGRGGKRERGPGGQPTAESHSESGGTVARLHPHPSALRQGKEVMSPTLGPLRPPSQSPSLLEREKETARQAKGGPATWPVDGSLNALNRPAANWPNKQNKHLLSSEAMEPCRSPLLRPRGKSCHSR